MVADFINNRMSQYAFQITKVIKYLIAKLNQQFRFFKKILWLAFKRLFSNMGIII